LGLKDLIGTGTTDFTGSPANRVANIKNGVNLINGLLVQPGAEFSTVGALSPIDEAHGYVQGLVIVNNQTLPADGGGLCQVSTTLFRSILNAGLPITARTPHSYEVSYYQRGVGPGLDATIYDPKPDFKWVNDTGHVIFIQGVIKNMNLTFNLFGTSDGRTAVVTGPTLLSTTEPSGGPIYVNTDTLPYGTTHQIDPPVPGGKTTATYTVTRGGVVINTQTFKSTYQAMPAQFLVGTAGAPPGVTPPPEPTCSDTIQNGDETGVDCGGSCPNACPAPAPTN
jgi:vancomycin resistance protein YoaR